MTLADQSEPARLPIRHSEIGKYLSDLDCVALVTVMNVRDYADRDILVKTGDADSTLFILVAGAIDVIDMVNGRKKVVHKMKPGDCAGIRSFVERSPRAVTLRAKGPVTVYSMRPDDFELLLDSNPRQAYNFMRGLFRMLNINMERMHEKIRKLALTAGTRS